MHKDKLRHDEEMSESRNLAMLCRLLWIASDIEIFVVIFRIDFKLERRELLEK